MSVLIKDVLLRGKRVNILVEGNRITGIGGRYMADRVVDGRGKAAIPGLINTHTHAAMTLLRGFADDLQLREWLERYIWPVEGKMTEDDVYWGTRLACLEMIKSGTTCFNDMYWHLPAAAKAVEDSGIRGVLSGVFIDMFSRDKSDIMRSEVERQIKECRYGQRVRIALGPHAVYTVTEEGLIWAKELADKEGLLIHFHLSETRGEVDDCVKAHGMRPVEYLDSIGFLGPNLVAAHCVWLSRREMELLGKWGVKVAHCPTSNMKLAAGVLDFTGLSRAGVTVSLGTDGCASNNNLDMFEGMKFAALLQKTQLNDPTSLPAYTAFEMATSCGAKALGLDAGEISEGKLADIVLVDLRRPDMTPTHNITSNLVYSANGGCVDTVICDGEIVMEGGKVEGEDSIIEKVVDVAADLVVRK